MYDDNVHDNGMSKDCGYRPDFHDDKSTTDECDQQRNDTLLQQLSDYIWITRFVL